MLEEEGDVIEEFYQELNKECVLKEEVDAREDLHQCIIRTESRMFAGGGGRRQREFIYSFDSNLIRDVCCKMMETPERIKINI